jgi:hypothetical protein
VRLRLEYRSMCLPACTMELAEAASRRRFLKRATLAACASVIAPPITRADEPPRPGFQRVVDLTHTLNASFPATWPNAFVLEQRQVKGIATDTLSLDPGNSADFPVHHYWLGHNKWGLENVAGLGGLPAQSSTIVVGVPKIAGSTGGPCRVLALV